MSDISRMGRARTVNDMLAEIPGLHTADTPQAIPLLARYSRQAPGWLRVAVFGALRLIVGTGMLILSCILLLRVVPFLLITPAQFLLRWDDGAGWLMVALCVSLMVMWIYQSNNVRLLLGTIEDTIPQGAPSYLHWSRAAIAVVGKVAALIVIAVFLLATFLPIGFALVNGVEWLAKFALRFLPITLPIDVRWIVTILSLLLVALIIGRWVLRIRAGRSVAGTFTLAVLWLIGVYFWFRVLAFAMPDWLLSAWDMSFLAQWAEISPLLLPLQEIVAALDDLRQMPRFDFGFGLWVVITLCYPFGIAFWFARWPVRLLSGLLATLISADARIRLRLDIGRALRHHRERNSQLTAGQGWSTVCQKDLYRFQLVTERLAYGRWINYAHCPVCQEDQPAYTHVFCRTLLFDNAFSLAEEQQGNALFFSGQQWLAAHRNRNGHVHVPFESVRIGAVDELDIEEFQTVFADLDVDRTLGQLSVKNTHTPLADSNALRQLESEIGTVVQPNAVLSCPELMAQRLRRVESNTKARFAVLHVLRTSLIVFSLLALFIGGAHGWRWWSTWDKGGKRVVLVEIRVTPTPKTPVIATDLSSQDATVMLPSPSIKEPAALIEPTPATQYTVDTDGMLLLLVPQGEFEMGNADGLDAPRDEYPVHTVYLDAFYIDAYEVSNAQYRACEAADVCAAPISNVSFSHVNYHTDARFDAFPVIKVSWFDAEAYCNWVGRRLPTEAEWEKAARWHPGKSNVTLYPWGNDAPSPEHAVFASSSNDPVAVASLAEGRSAVGAFHMAGNVWEWVTDWYAPDYYDVAAEHNPTGPENGSRKVVRGGSYGVNAQAVRSSARWSYPPNDSLFDTGFRCARDVE